VFAAQLYAAALSLPLVISYHTHIPEYIKSYTWQARPSRNKLTLTH
jgi:sulfoquinovosyltransferase